MTRIGRFALPVFAGALLLLLGPVWAQDNTGAPTEIAQVGSFSGEVLIRSGATGEARKVARVGTKIRNGTVNAGDEIATGAGGKVELLFADGTVLQLDQPDTQVVLSETALNEKLLVGKAAGKSVLRRIKVLAGRIHSEVKPGTSIYTEFETPSGVAGVKGTVLDIDVSGLPPTATIGLGDHSNISFTDPQSNYEVPLGDGQTAVFSWDPTTGRLDVNVLADNGQPVQFRLGGATISMRTGDGVQVQGSPGGESATPTGGQPTIREGANGQDRPMQTGHSYPGSAGAGADGGGNRRGDGATNTGGAGGTNAGGDGNRGGSGEDRSGANDRRGSEGDGRDGAGDDGRGGAGATGGHAPGTDNQRVPAGGDTERGSRGGTNGLGDAFRDGVGGETGRGAFDPGGGGAGPGADARSGVGGRGGADFPNLNNGDLLPNLRGGGGGGTGGGVITEPIPPVSTGGATYLLLTLELGHLFHDEIARRLDPTGPVTPDQAHSRFHNDSAGGASPFFQGHDGEVRSVTEHAATLNTPEGMRDFSDRTRPNELAEFNRMIDQLFGASTQNTGNSPEIFPEPPTTPFTRAEGVGNTNAFFDLLARGNFSDPSAIKAAFNLALDRAQLNYHAMIEAGGVFADFDHAQFHHGGTGGGTAPPPFGGIDNLHDSFHATGGDRGQMETWFHGNFCNIPRAASDPTIQNLHALWHRVLGLPLNDCRPDGSTTQAGHVHDDSHPH